MLSKVRFKAEVRNMTQSGKPENQYLQRKEPYGPAGNRSGANLLVRVVLSRKKPARKSS